MATGSEKDRAGEKKFCPLAKIASSLSEILKYKCHAECVNLILLRSKSSKSASLVFDGMQMHIEIERGESNVHLLIWFSAFHIFCLSDCYSSCVLASRIDDVARLLYILAWYTFKCVSKKKKATEGTEKKNRAKNTLFSLRQNDKKIYVCVLKCTPKWQWKMVTYNVRRTQWDWAWDGRIKRQNTT